ncbi:excisionase [Azospirillum sp. TSA2s]|uniref:excisionase n=1 Tax=Azospirillum sp. TSA2s TaxID=709810 RepID=UPI0010AB0634|nr:excisionase [Azospirillum sp. TSA2s]QCG95028.1 excisionase [Azospirillum sp. TSA2s]
MGDKLLTLEEWANANYASPPGIKTLQRWARERKIYPPPEKHGKEYKVQPGARYLDPTTPIRSLPSSPTPASKPRLADRI